MFSHYIKSALFELALFKVLLYTTNIYSQFAVIHYGDFFNYLTPSYYCANRSLWFLSAQPHLLSTAFSCNICNQITLLTCKTAKRCTEYNQYICRIQMHNVDVFSFFLVPKYFCQYFYHIVNSNMRDTY